MSRETDSSSSGPQGRGGAAYPSGTPPYGSRPFPSLHPQERPRPGGTPEPAAAPEPPPADEPKTETTLTTRIRINIPGSRPIPPVVVRKPVDENNPAPEPPAPEPASAAEPAAAEASGEPEPQPEKTSDWFAPRKSQAGQPGPGSAPAPGAGSGTGAGPAAGAGAGSGAGSDSRTGSSPYPSSAAAPGTASTPYLPPPVGTPQGGDPSARGPHDTPAAGVPSLFAGEFGPEFGTEPQPEPPYGIDAFPPGVPRPAGTFPGPDPYGRPEDQGQGQGQSQGQGQGQGQGPDPLSTPYGAQAAAAPYAPPADGPNSPFPEYQPPAGPTTGPVTGHMQVPPAADQRGRSAPSAFRPPTPGDGPGPEDTSGGFRAPTPPGDGLGPEDTSGGFRPPVVPDAPGGRLSDDTLVSGIPAVQPGGPGARTPRAPGPAAPVPGGPGAGPVPAPVVAEPRAAQPAPAAPRPPAKKKGRSKVALLGVGVCTIAVLAYGAGLLMTHGDVPKGTTVVGVDIGNQNKGDAVKMLDTALGDRKTAPLELTIGDRKLSLKPSVAGLSVDTDATVRGVAHSDYNPVSVVGSLFGGSRVADPVIVVDEDKLRVALKSLAGQSGSGSDGMVRFADGKAVPVAGTSGQSFDVNAAAAKVAAAYRTRAETGSNPAVALPVTTTPPKVTQAELDAAVNGFGKRAMSDFVVVRAGLKSIKFGPMKSIPKFLTMVPNADGKLQPHIDLAVLKGLYGGTFDTVKLKAKDGSTRAVTPQDVADALLPALDATGAKRDVTLPNVAG
ncbi:hypothetical protein ACIQCJ_09145 [Streptomyces sp. NPDC093221]|uniref:hypothetical protein n=1 Tax=Streptomyces sp. NPDC093221 TaxID=3366032 RepID=UPI00380F1EF1